MSRLSCSHRPVSPNQLVSVSLAWADQRITVGALLDSGAEGCFLDSGFAAQAGIPLEPLERPMEAFALDERRLASVTQRTLPVSLTIAGNHKETRQFFIIRSPLVPVILGRPWFVQHEPHIAWSTGAILEWSPSCLAQCLQAAPSTLPHQTPSYPPPDLSSVPLVYHDLGEVFSKTRAQSLPPHRPYDCAIDLRPGATLPSSRLYSLSLPEKAAMEEYISESLAAGLIRPSSSQVAAGFFFVKKKDGGLRPCIDYRQLNDITLKNKYPLPLMSSTLEPLTQATVFTKLDLRSAYHLVRIRSGDEWKTAFKTPRGHYEYLVMPFGLTNAPAVFQALMNDVLRDMLDEFVVVYLDDILIFSRGLEEHVQHVRRVLERLLHNRLFVKAEKCRFHTTSVDYLGFIVEKGQTRADPRKIQAVVDWLDPTSRKELQSFLGFANFYRRFIRNYSSIAEPLTRLTSPSKPFIWSPAARSAFQMLKGKFTSAPVLLHPDPERQFIVEVDASDTGLGAVLSQRSAADMKVHPCAFFSRRFLPAEENYDIGNRELLAVVAALEEWRHWLEGAKLPFTIWTDHKNLTFIRATKRLNGRQARWASFLSRFNFTLTYRPGSRNTKADALSRQHPKEPATEEPSPILPET